LEALRQGSSSVPEYAAAFKQKAAHTSFSDYNQRQKFRTGLQDRIKVQLAHVPYSGKDTLKKLIEHAIQIGRNFKELDADKKKTTWWIPRQGPKTPEYKAGPSKDSDTMDIDSGRQRGAPKPQGKTGSFKCYRCGEEGHMARN
ncbi:uncharacterized protein F5147DRAFT_525622, partial [Suillus discolor]